MHLPGLHRFEWLEARNLLNGNPLLDLPQPSGLPDSPVVHAAPGNPSDVTVQLPIASTSAASPQQGSPLSDHAVNEALPNSRQDQPVSTTPPGPELPANAVRIPDQGSILIGGVVDKGGGQTARSQPVTMPNQGTLLLGGIMQPSESHGDGSLLITVTPRIAIQAE